MEELGSRDSLVGIATGYGLDNCGSIPGSRKDFSLIHRALAVPGALTTS
jgi:hypothetical protein